MPFGPNPASTSTLSGITATVNAQPGTQQTAQLTNPTPATAVA